MDGIQLHRFFWVVLSGLGAAVAAIVFLLRSGRAVAGPTPGAAGSLRLPRL